MTVDEIGRALVATALLEGDFVLRSGKRSTYYLDKYRFETDPELLRALGGRAGGGRAAGGAGSVTDRRAGPRSGRTGRFCVHGVRGPLHHRAR